MTNVTMIDYGFGNVRSVQKALQQIGASVTLSDEPAAIPTASRLVLPGVGAFGAAMKALHAQRLVGPLLEAAEQGTPILGICLGLQLLFEESEEMGLHEGLGLLPGRVLRFQEKELKVPHMGWNQLQPARTHPLLAGVPSGAYAYFVHSYYCQPEHDEDLIAATEYGTTFAAIAGRDNVVGLQFHPEKSQHVGLHILRNFLAWEGNDG